jgi:3-oxoacyl-[acyl-carrier protein] reductase
MSIRSAVPGSPPLSGRAAIVTGVSRRTGIGFAIARRLALLGADLLLHGWSAHDRAMPWGNEPASETSIVDELRSLGVAVGHVEEDLADPDAPRRVVASAVDVYGHVDVLVANHARSGGRHPIEELTARELDAHLAVNTRGTLLLVKEFAGQHDGRAGGRVVMMSSGQHLGPMPTEIPYAASKAALNQLTPTLAAAVAERGITVNTVNPGPTDTGWADPETHARVLDGMPRGRWGTPDDAARLIAWLATDDAEWITGQVIDSTGGFG